MVVLSFNSLSVVYCLSRWKTWWWFGCWNGSTRWGVKCASRNDCGGFEGSWKETTCIHSITLSYERFGTRLASIQSWWNQQDDRAGVSFCIKFIQYLCSTGRTKFYCVLVNVKRGGDICPFIWFILQTS